MKELKRSRKAPQCTRWFCAADSVFRYEVHKVNYKLKERCDNCCIRSEPEPWCFI